METRRVHQVTADAAGAEPAELGTAARLLASGAALATASCGGPQNMMAPAGPAAQKIAWLGWFVLIPFIAVTVIMWVLVFWAAVRRRGSLAHHLPWNAPDDRRWVIVGGFIVPVIVLATIYLVTLKTMAAFPMGDEEMAHHPAEIRVIGHQWWWEVHYLAGGVDQQVVTANEIHVPAGRPVDIELAAHDVIHSFWVPRLQGKVDLVPGTANRITLRAERPGVYEGQCAEFCGMQHAQMRLQVVAQPETEYRAWLAAQRQPAPATTADPLAEQGRNAFMAGACPLCHTVRGTAAHGTVGPDLTHVGARHRIAGGAFVNDSANLEAWVTDAQSMKPGSQMPTLHQFDGADLRAVVHYLQTLR
jgi:cytochrome c oxidase subunit 2